MKAEFFKAVCPLEVGDTVAIKATKDGEAKEALYLPHGCTVITKAQLYLKSQKELQKLSHTQQYTTQEDTMKTAEKKSG